MAEIGRHIVSELEVGLRLDRCLADVYPILSRSRIERCIAEGDVRVNEKTEQKKNRPLHLGDALEIKFPDPVDTHLEVIGSLNLLYEDRDLLIINKPAGISVHPGAGERRVTIMDILLKDYPETSDMLSVTDRPGIVHRLDRDTSGVLVLARNMATMDRMMDQFKTHTVHKHYLGIVAGIPRIPSGEIDRPLIRSRRDRRRVTISLHPDDPDARSAVTRYQLLLRMGDSALMRLSPQTGRTHQLRVHMRHAGTPILGDPWYSTGGPEFPRLGLHAHEIRFAHPTTSLWLRARAPIPLEFLDFIHSRLRG